MKEYYVAAIHAADSTGRYIHAGNAYYVYDEADNSIELWDGKDLLKAMELLSDVGMPRLNIRSGMSIIVDNELILASNGVYAYIWYNNCAEVWDGSALVTVHGLDPIRIITLYSERLDKYKINFKDMLRKIVMEVS